MHKFIIPVILIVLAVGMFFTYTDKHYQKVKELRAVNAQYEQAIADSLELIKKRDQVVTAYNSISAEDRERLDKILPDHVDNIRLIIDIRTLLAVRGVAIKNIKTGASNAIVGKEKVVKNPSAQAVSAQTEGETKTKSDGQDSVTLSFSFTSSYETFLTILNDLEQGLRLLEISKITFAPTDTGLYDFTIEVKTFWLKQ